MKALRDLWRETTRAERAWLASILVSAGALGACVAHWLTGGGR